MQDETNYSLSQNYINIGKADLCKRHNNSIAIEAKATESEKNAFFLSFDSNMFRLRKTSPETQQSSAFYNLSETFNERQLSS